MWNDAYLLLEYLILKLLKLLKLCELELLFEKEMRGALRNCSWAFDALHCHEVS